MRESEPWSLAEKIGIPLVLVGMASGAILTAAAIRYSTSTALWDLILWGGIAVAFGSLACLVLIIRSHFSGRSFVMPAILVFIGIVLIVAGIAWHLWPLGDSPAADMRVKNDAELSVFIECHFGRMPTHGQSIYQISLFPSPIEITRGYLTEHFFGNDENSPGEGLPKDHNGIDLSAYKCIITNYSSVTILNLSFDMQFRFINVMLAADGRTIGSGTDRLIRPWNLFVPKIDPGADRAFAFYMFNMNPDVFVHVTFPDKAFANTITSDIKREVKVITPAPGMIIFFDPFISK